MLTIDSLERLVQLLKLAEILKLVWRWMFVNESHPAIAFCGIAVVIVLGNQISSSAEQSLITFVLPEKLSNLSGKVSLLRPVQFQKA